VALISLEKLPGLGAEAIHVGADGNATDLDFVPCPDLVLEIRIHNRAFFVFDQLNEVSQSRSPGRFGTNEGATTMQS